LLSVLARRVRDADTDLDHRRCDENVELARLELRHQVAPLRRPQSPVKEPDAVALQLPLPQPVGLALGSARDARLRLLDERADHIGLTAVVEMLAQAGVGLA